MTRTVTAQTMVLPLSGWSTMSSRGTPRTTAALARKPGSKLPPVRRNSSRSSAAASTTVILANSEGWKCRGPTAIQRVAP